MNLLPYVLGFLLLLALFNAAQLNIWEETKKSELIWSKKGNTLLQDATQIIQNERYNSLHRENDQEEPKTPSTRSSGVSCLSLAALFEEGAYERREPKTLAVATIFKTLLEQLFYKDPFYQTLIQEHPEALEALFKALPSAGERSARFKKNPSTKNLLTLNFSDPSQRELWYQLFRGAQSIDACSEEIVTQKKAALLSFVNMKKGTPPLRLFLLPDELLIAIYGDLKIVEEVIHLREQLYKLARRDPAQNPLLTKQFEEALEPVRPRWLPKELLNYDVSSTAPPKMNDA